MTRGSRPWLVRALRDWAQSVQQGMALVTYRSNATRELVLNDLSQAFQAGGLKIETVQSTQFTAEDFVRRIARSDADVIFVLDPDRVLFGDSGDLSRFWINFHRETLVGQRGVQIWWMPPDAAIRFGSQLPDLNRFFLFREELKTGTEIERDTSLKFQLSYREAIRGDPNRGPDFLERALRAAEAAPKPDAKRIWLELGIPAIDGFVRAGQTMEGQEALSRLAKILGPPEEALERILPDSPREVARGFLTLATLHRLRALEVPDRSESLLRALASYERALHLLPRDRFPEDWAAGEYGIGVAYRYLTEGDRGANLRKAIESFRAALEVYAEREFPWDWARTMNNLGTTYASLPASDADENLTRAIACYEAALRVRTEREFPKDWADTQLYLGIAYLSLPPGDRNENLGRAIAFCGAALRVYTEQEFPRDWAAAQGNLGLAYHNLSTGNLGDNLSRAIGYYEAALRVYTAQEDPNYWAQAQFNLGDAYQDLRAGDRGENLHRAIAHYEAALHVYAEQKFPENWADIQFNLGLAYRNLPVGDRRENLRHAIRCYEAAQRVPAAADIATNQLQLARQELAQLSEAEDRV